MAMVILVSLQITSLQINLFKSLFLDRKVPASVSRHLFSVYCLLVSEQTLNAANSMSKDPASNYRTSDWRLCFTCQALPTSLSSKAWLFPYIGPHCNKLLLAYFTTVPKQSIQLHSGLSMLALDIKNLLEQNFPVLVATHRCSAVHPALFISNIWSVWQYWTTYSNV